MILGSLTVLALALRLACSTGLIGSDDLSYAAYARALMEGHYAETLNEARSIGPIHWGLRHGVLIPLAAIYSAFGVSEWTTIVLPLAASTASVLLLVEIARRMFDMRVAILAGLLYATFPLQLGMGTVLVPEPIAECFALLGVLVYLHARRRGGGLWVAAGALMGIAYLAKEPALFVGGAVFLHAVWERRWRGGMLLALGLASVVIVEHGYYFFGQGDVLLRLHGAPAYYPDGLPDLSQSRLFRLFTRYPRVMIEPNVKFGLHSLACLIGAAAALSLKPRWATLLVLWAAVPWLYLNFGSSSLEQYSPLPKDERYIELTYPPLMVLSGVVLSRALAARASIARPAGAVLGVVLVAGVYSGLAMRGTHGRAEEMAVLREMVRVMHREPGQTVHTDNARWRRALDIFDPALISEYPEMATFFLEPDPIGLPALRRPLATPDNEPLLITTP